MVPPVREEAHMNSLMALGVRGDPERFVIPRASFCRGCHVWVKGLLGAGSYSEWFWGTCELWVIYTVRVVRHNILGKEAVSVAFLHPFKTLYASCGEKCRM